MSLLEALSLANGSELSQAAMLLLGKQRAIARYMPSTRSPSFAMRAAPAMTGGWISVAL